MRRRVITSILLAFLIPLGLWAQEIRDIEIRVALAQDGSATVTTDWDVTVVDGTEWYVPVGNLGPMKVDSLSVWENGTLFEDEGFGWNSNRSQKDKAGRSGIIKKSNGVELCWGQGSLGPHKWRTQVHMTGLVQGMTDYDGFNFQFVNPDMIAGPQHVRVTIVNETGIGRWTQANTKVWAFGFKGNIQVVNGTIVAETSNPMKQSHHVTLMVRFDKFQFIPAVNRNYFFSKMEKQAKKGSNYFKKEDAEKYGLMGLIAIAAAWLAWVVGSIKSGKKYNKKLFGSSQVKGWHREVPLDGNLFAAYYVLLKGNRYWFQGGGEDRQLMGALFLKWILEGKMKVQPDAGTGKHTNLVVDPEARIPDAAEDAFFQMAREAAGDNLVLEAKEFEKWSRKHSSQVEGWPEKAGQEGRNYLMEKGYLTKGDEATPAGQEPMRRVVEFRQFLKDFTLVNERSVPEVQLWNQYLVYASLFGIAEEVARQLEKLYPAEFAQYAKDLQACDLNLYSLVNVTQALSDAVKWAASSDSSREGGGGGFSSLGGGGGHSGGGHGGGSR